MLQLQGIVKSEPNKGTLTCQIVRSAAQWSLGLNEEENIIENSIQNAYIELIQNSKHFIYIENQFFISSTAGEPVNNEIARAILLRILKAHKKKEKFLVYIFLPLLPGFSGEIDDPKSTVLRVQIHWQYQSISRGEQSLFSELRKKGINPSSYIKFYSLRNHGCKNGTPATEIIYIHSKLMIIDDDKVILGSANINDRSMQGSRDSEIAYEIVIEDSKKISLKFGQTESFGSDFAFSLRVNLLREHTGLSESEISNPLDDQTIYTIDEIAKKNTDAYRKIFGCYPDDEIKSFEGFEILKKKKDLNSYSKLCKDIKAHIVNFPTDFLCEEDLSLKYVEKEFYVPNINFT